MRRTIVTGIAALALACACSKKDDKGGKDGEWAVVDCEKMMVHVSEILTADAVKGKPADQAEAIKKQVAAKHGEVVAACEKEKGTKKLTQKQYDCIMAAKDAAEMGGCK